MKPAEEILGWAIGRYGPRLALSTSFQREGMVVLDMAVRLDPSLHVLTLDTGRLPPETYEMIETVRTRYGITIETVSPSAVELDPMIAAHGPNLFHREIATRMLCCQIRKVRPLSRKLAAFDAVLVGLRRAQNETRAALEQVEDSANPVKISPLAEWSDAQVDNYTREHNVPQHPLYSAGYGSIGCAPCTRALRPGEDARAGRWWWEIDADKECGLHYTPDGRAKRKVDVMLEQVLESARA